MKNNPVLINEMYDLEQRIMECWQLVDDVNLLYEQVMDKDLHKDQDKLANALLGLHTVYGIKFEKAFETYEEALKQCFDDPRILGIDSVRKQKRSTDKKTYKAKDIFKDIEGDPDNVLMTIPPEIIKHLGLKEDDTVDVTARDNSLIISKVNKDNI
jgi:hypothetical protein